MIVEVTISKDILMDLIERHCISELNKACQTRELKIKNDQGYHMSDYKNMTMVASIEIGETLKEKPPR